MADITTRIFLFFLFIPLFSIPVEGQKKVTFLSSDGLTVSADLYLKDKNLPFILLFHQGNYSRGEFKEIAPKLLNLNYNCLSVDLRSGGKINFIENETNQNAVVKKIPHAMLDARADINASILYVKNFNNIPVVLFGSSYSASLSLVIGNQNPDVRAVIAFSPGEFFSPALIVKESLKGFDKQVFVASTRTEYSYLVKMLSAIPPQHITYFTPKDSAGIPGAKALWESSPGNQEYWLALFIFFKELNGTGIDKTTSLP